MAKHIESTRAGYKLKVFRISKELSSRRKPNLNPKLCLQSHRRSKRPSFQQHILQQCRQWKMIFIKKYGLKSSTRLRRRLIALNMRLTQMPPYNTRSLSKQYLPSLHDSNPKTHPNPSPQKQTSPTYTHITNQASPKWDFPDQTSSDYLQDQRQYFSSIKSKWTIQDIKLINGDQRATRRRMIQQLVDLCRQLPSTTSQTLFCAISIVDEVFRVQHEIDFSVGEVLTILGMAWKIHEVKLDAWEKKVWNYCSEGGLMVGQFRKAMKMREMQILEMLDWRLNIPSTYDCITVFEDSSGEQKAVACKIYQLVSTRYYEFLMFKPSDFCEAIFLYINSPFHAWENHLQDYRHFVRLCITKIKIVLQQVDEQKLMQDNCGQKSMMMEVETECSINQEVNLSCF